ncbi:MAG: hypothetical protein ISS56_01055 [Anaerolineae bacterium]|nr:hypothetical protein [Anaerolineae bacterium]
MKKRWVYLFALSALAISLVLLLRPMPSQTVRATDSEHKVYLPFFAWIQREGFDDFTDLDPEWDIFNLARQPEQKDGTFRYIDGKLRGEIRDNAVRMVASPPWLTDGDYRLEVDAQYEYHHKQSWDGLGLVFGGNSDFTEYYTFMLAYNPEQHFWGIFRIKGFRTESIDRDWWIGSPGFVRNEDGWNHLEVIRVGNKIKLYINGGRIRDLGEDYTDSHYFGARRVGVVITSYEMNYHNINFDNFRLSNYTDEGN